ncbi:Glycoside hydrolase, 38 vacuolar alpha mannosidase [Thecaphora frezii]
MSSTIPAEAQHHRRPVYPIQASEEPRSVRIPLLRSVTERRLGEFVGGQYGDYNLGSLLFEHRTDDAEYVRIERWSPPAGTKPTFDEAKMQHYQPAKKGDTFGPSWTNHWLKLHLTVPNEWRQKDWVQLEFDPGCEAMIFTEDGQPLQGITGGYDDNRRVDFPLKLEARSGVLLYVEVTANGMFGLPSDSSGDPDPNRFFELASCDIVVKRAEAWKLMWDFDTLRQSVQEMPKDSILQNKALWVANQIQDTFRKADLGSIGRCRELAEEILGQGWDGKREKIYEEDIVPGREDTRIWCLGHTHIDSAWLWPYSATQQKVARSWSTQLDLMDRYPEHRFTASTAQQYQWLERLYPQLFHRVQEKVKEGKFQPVGGTWVECDANMPSGEAFVRQFVYGQRYFLSRFGKRTDIFWLPDTFGYNAQIPQLARQAGCDYFFTQKLSWNNINRFPHNSMMWVGLDGTQIIVHLTPINNYDSQCGVNDIIRGIKNNQDLWVQDSALLLFGFGDGGGGPTEVMLERLRRARAVNNNGFKDMPRVTMGRSARDFFEHVRTTTDNGKRLSTWSGELYLEFHRGVYTSHGSIKHWNRYLELELGVLEWVNTLASLKVSGFEYPKQELDEIWEPFLLNQFHDCLPGSAIRKVYDDLESMYADMLAKATKLYRRALKALGISPEPNSTAISASADVAAAAATAGYSMINTLGIPRRELVSIELSGVSRAEAIALSHQSVQLCQGDERALLLVEDLLGSGLAHSVEKSANVMRSLEAVSVEQTAHNEFVLRNASISLKVSGGRIVSIYDHVVGRELIERGRTAGLSIAEDFPPQFDNWETEVYSLDTIEEIPFDSVRIAEKGPWRSSLALNAKFGQSSVELTISLDAVPATILTASEDARALLRFDMRIDWWEKHRFLRFEVPTALRADNAAYETQFGLTKRPTTRNTSWEAAKFEVCGHRWADLSEPDYGLSILTESKYGYSTEGGRMRLSLLKAGTYPDAHEDEGQHAFAFALYPHVGGLARGQVVHVARIFTSSMSPPVHPGTVRSEAVAVAGPGSVPLPGAEARMPIEQLVKTPSWYLAMPIRVLPHGGSVVVSAVKRAEEDFAYGGKAPAEKGSVSVVLRLYESLGCHSEPSLEISTPIKSVSVTNLLEDEDGEATEALRLQTYTSTEDDEVTLVSLDFRPFEIKTVKIRIA